MEKAELAEKFGFTHDGRIVKRNDYATTRCVLVAVNLILLAIFLFAVVFGFFPSRDQGETNRFLYEYCLATS